MCYDGYYYILDNINSVGKHLWKCERCNNSKKYVKCPARIHTIDDAVVKFVNEHNHLPVPERKKCLEVVNEIKCKAKITNEKPRSIITSSQTTLNDIEAAIMTRKNNLNQRINYQRSKNIDKGPGVSDRSEFDLLDELKKTILNC